MRICVVHNSYGKPSGEEVVVSSIGRLLEERGHEVSWFTRSSAELEQMRFGRMHAFFSGVYSVTARRDFERALAAHRPDIVHIHNLFPLISPSILPACLKAGVPVVMTVHNYRLICPNGLHFSHGEICEKCAGGREYWCILRNCEGNLLKSTGYALRNAVARLGRLFRDGVAVYSANTEFQRRKLIAEGYAADRIHVIPNMIDSLGAAEGRPGTYVGFAGRVSPEKGAQILVEAASLLPNIPFKIAGAFDRMPELVRHAPGNVEFLGHLLPQQLDQFYHDCRMLVVPSICYEALTTVIPQAMVRGKPIVCSDIGTLPEAVMHGKTGLLFRVGDADELARQVRTLWTRPEFCARMGEAARERALQEYSRDRYYDRLLAAYEQALSLGRAQVRQVQGRGASSAL